MRQSNIDIYFGGPDLAKNQLRDTLLASIQKTPSGATIKWLCYYLNDQAILNALINASKRSVNVTLLIDKHPRLPEVNAISIEQLLKHASPTLKLITLEKKPIWHHLGIKWHAHFHSKCYYFSAPTPHIFIGSYNPTAGYPELSIDIIKEIGDHAISHNVLLKITKHTLVSVLIEHINNMQLNTFINKVRFLPSQNHAYLSDEWQIDFLPRLNPHPINKLLKSHHKPANIKCAISHLKGPGIKKTLAKANKKHKIELLIETSKRRVPQAVLDFLQKHEITTYQPTLPEHCLMHNKFILYDNGDEKKVMFGSFNWSARSKMLNHEIILSTTNQQVYTSFEERWKAITKNKHNNHG